VTRLPVDIVLDSGRKLNSCIHSCGLHFGAPSAASILVIAHGYLSSNFAYSILRPQTYHSHFPSSTENIAHLISIHHCVPFIHSAHRATDSRTYATLDTPINAAMLFANAIVNGILPFWQPS
jgi:hypothetical protein